MSQLQELGAQAETDPGVAWDPTDDELDSKWAVFESGWDGLSPNDDPTARHVAGFATACFALLVLGILAAVAWMVVVSA
ncbi:MAG: hypothetical protein ACJ739_08925 [Acidimicrobiales bacterium]